MRFRSGFGSRLAPLHVALLLLAACSSDLAVPPEAQLSCASGADCPSGWACNEKVGRCVKTENIDSDAPALAGEVTVTPTVLKKGAKATVSFSVSEELSKPPVVSVSAGTDRVLTQDSGLKTQDYVFTYVASGGEPEGVESPISIVLTDKSGNESGKLSGGSLKFDFVAPALVDSTVEGSPVNKTGTVTVTLTVNEKPASAPVLELSTGEVLTPSGEPKETKYTFTYAPSGNETEDAAGVGLTVDLADEAGNTSTAPLEKTVLFDFTKPKLKNPPVVTPAVAAKASLVTVAFEADEELGADPVVRLGGIELSKGSGAGTTFTYTHIAEEVDGEGEKEVVVSFVDKAGNPSGDLPGGAVTFDFTEPGISEPKVEPSRAKAGAPVTVTFTVDEPLNTDPVVKAGSIAFAKVGEPRRPFYGQVLPFPAPGVEYVYSYVLQGTEEQTGLTVTVDLTDEAGNSATGLVAGSFVPDFVAPSILGTPAINKPFAKAGDEVTVAFSVSEAQKTDPVVAAGALVFSKKNQNGSDYVYAYTLAGTETQGLTNVTIDLLDAAENAAVALSGGRFTIDFDKPALSGAAVASPAVAQKGQLVTLDFDVSEELGAEPQVTLAGKPMNKQAQSGTHYTYNALAAEGDGEGTKDTSIQLVDRAGNGSGSIAGPAVTFDFSVPVATVTEMKAGPYRSPKTGESGVDVHAKFTTGEDLDPAKGQVKVKVGDKWTATCADGAKTTFDCTFKVPDDLQPDDELEGVKAVILDITDGAGNAAIVNAGTVTFDFTAPVLALRVEPAGRPARLGESVTIGVSSNEPLDGDGVALDSGTLVLGAPSVTGTSYTWTYTVKDTDNASFDLSAAAKDEAGNAAGAAATGSVALDGVVPAISNVKLWPSRVAGNGTFTFSFDASETLAADPSLFFSNGAEPAVAMVKIAAEAGYKYTYEGTAPASGSVPFYALTVTVTDGAGNQGTYSPVTVAIDNVAPGVANLSVSPESARLNQTLLVILAANETLWGPPQMSAHSGANVITFVPGDSTPGEPSYSYTYFVDPATPEGTYTIDPFTLTDEAQNAQVITPNPPKTFSVDSTLPVVGAIAADKPVYSRVSGYDTVMVRFDVSENVDSGLTVTVGTEAMTCDPYSATPSNYTCRYATKSGDTDGVKVVNVQASDAAGNTQPRTGSVVFDFTSPSVLSAGPSGSIYKAGDTLLYTVNASEPLLGAPGRPVVHVFKGGDEQAGFFGNPATETETSFTYSKPVAGLDGTHTVTVDLLDRAGNAATGSAGGGFTIDTVQPVVAEVSLNTSNANNTLAKNSDVVTAGFTVTEDPPASPQVTIGNQAMNLDSKSGSGPYTFTYKRTAQTADGGGVKNVGVSLTDAAGNPTSYPFTATVTYDFQAPGFSSSAPTTPVGLNKVLTYTLNASEPLLGNPALNVNPALTLSGPSQSGTLYTWTRTIDGTETQGAFTVTANLTDLAGNTTTGAPAAGFSIDRIPPSIATGPTLNKNPAFYKVGDTVTVTFTMNEDLDATLPVATLNTTTPVNMPCVAGGGTNDYTCSLGRNLNAGDLPEGQVSLSLALQDAAQNTGFGSATLTLDFTNPALVSATPSQAYYRGGQTIVYTVSASEPLSGSPGRPTMRVYKDSALQTDYFVNPSSETDTSFAYTKAVTPDGTYTLQVDLTDKAGNVNNVLPGTGWTIDATAPVVNQVSLTTNNPNFNDLAKDGDEVTAVFTLSEDPPSNPAVAIGIQPMSFVSKTGTGPWTFTYTRTALSGDVDGPKSVTVSTVDTAGNSTVYYFTLFVTYDFTAPGVTVGSEFVQLYPFSGCPASLAVTKVAFNTTARVSFASNEALLSDPVVTTNPSAGTWSIVKYSSVGNLYVYDVKPTGGSPTQGVTQVRVAMTDRAGNQTPAPISLSLPAPGVDVDTIAPAPITPTQNDRILYRRIPWGSNESAGVKKFGAKTLDGQTNAVEPNSTVIFWDAANIATAAEIGRTTADGNGYFAEKDLNRADRAHVYLTQVDQAGNVDSATATELKNHEWTATMGYKVPGSMWDNPNVFLNVSIFAPGTLRQDPATTEEPSPGELSDLLGIDSNALVHLAARTWSELNGVVDRPSARSSHAVAYDSARGRTVLFGGNDGSDDHQTWEWDGSTWTQLFPDNEPTARSSHAMIYDSARGKTVLFGGDDGAKSDETWEWDGNNWAQIFPATKPSARSSHAMAYDSARGRVILFGGFDGSEDDETWEWDGNNWAQIFPATKPSARSFHAMAYDSERGKTVLFGGTNVASNDETWEWDGNNWTQRFPVNKPSARKFHAMAHDSARGKTILFGGNDGAYDNETWEWNGTNWTQRLPFNSPSARSSRAMAYDSARGKTVLFGGYDGALDDETWEWNGTSWTQRLPFNIPSARRDHAMAYDSARGKTVLFGGNDGARDDETWEWDGNNWTQRFPANKPSTREFHAIAYDGVRGKTVLFGGSDGARDDETWEWDGNNWAQIFPANKPSARTGHAMAHDSARGKTVLFGGNDTANDDETWEWDGSNWTQRNPTGKPSARQDHAMAYDSARGKTVLFGGNDSASDDETWEWDGNNWTQRFPVNKPSARWRHAMAYDSARGTIVLFGGINGGDETWEWDGNNWTQVLPFNKPSVRLDHAMAYDGMRGKVVLFGGNGVGNETWEWDGGTSQRPGQSLQVSFAAAGVSSSVQTQSVQASFYSGGSGFSGAGYWLGQKAETWSDAKATCESLGPQSHLVTISDAAEQTAMQNLLHYPRNTWIGLNDLGAEGVFQWVDGAPLAYTNWGTSPPQPDDWAGNEDCAHIWDLVSGQEYRWNDSNCANTMSFICELGNTNGVNLQVWDEGMWKVVATNNSPPGTPSLVSWTTTDPAVISRLFFGDQQTLNFAVTPVAPNGTGIGEISTDYAEVTVKYRLP